MLINLAFTKKWRCFKEFDSFKFRPGVNLLVGDQGCGKSSLLETIKDAGPTSICDRAIIETDGQCQSYFFDFEKGNPRTLSYFKDDTSSQIAMMFSSHGQANMALINASEHGSD
jgi:predicted ATPase